MDVHGQYLLRTKIRIYYTLKEKGLRLKKTFFSG